MCGTNHKTTFALDANGFAFITYIASHKLKNLNKCGHDAIDIVHYACVTKL